MDTALGRASRGGLGISTGAGGAEGQEGEAQLPGDMTDEQVGMALAQGLAATVAAQHGGAGPGSVLLTGAGVNVPRTWWAEETQQVEGEEQ
jgi:hypothetical protein